MYICIIRTITSIYIENSISQCYNFYVNYHTYFGQLKRSRPLYFIY